MPEIPTPPSLAVIIAVITMTSLHTRRRADLPEEKAAAPHE